MIGVDHMSDSTKNAAESSKKEMNRYQRVLADLHSEDKWDREYAEKTIGSFYFQRPTDTKIHRAIYKMLGGLPGDVVLEMDKPKTKSVRRWFEATLGLVIALAVFTAILVVTPTLGLSNVFALPILALGISPIGLGIAIMSIAYFAIWKFARHTFLINDEVSGDEYHDAIVAASGFSERRAAIETLMFRAGAEHWTISQKAYAIFMSATASGVVFFLPVPVAVATLAVHAYFLAIYLKEYRKSGSTAIAATETAKTVYLYRNLFPVYVAVAMNIWFHMVDFWLHLGHALVAIGKFFIGLY